MTEIRLAPGKWANLVQALHQHYDFVVLVKKVVVCLSFEECVDDYLIDMVIQPYDISNNVIGLNIVTSDPLHREIVQGIVNNI